MDEIEAVRRAGADVSIHPLLRERAARGPSRGRPSWRPRLTTCRSCRPPSWPARSSWLRPSTRATTSGRGARCCAGTWGSLNFIVGGIGVFPKAAHMARSLMRTASTHVHCHFATHPALAGFIVHRLTGIPFSFTAHGSDLHVDRHMLPQKVEEAAFVATISDYNRQVIIDTCGAAARGRSHVVRVRRRYGAVRRSSVNRVARARRCGCAASARCTRSRDSAT